MTPPVTTTTYAVELLVDAHPPEHPEPRWVLIVDTDNREAAKRIYAEGAKTLPLRLYSITTTKALLNEANVK